MPLNLNPFNAFGLQLQGPAPQRQMAQQAPINIDAERRKREQAAQMLAEAVKGRRIVHPSQGYAQMGEALLGVVNQRRADKKIGEYEQRRQEGLMSAANAYLDGDVKGAVESLGMFDPEMAMKMALSTEQATGPEWEEFTYPDGRRAQRNLKTGEIKAAPQFTPNKGNSFSMSYDEQGRPVVSFGPGASGAGGHKFDNTSKRAFEKEWTEAGEMLHRMTALEESFDERYLTYEGKFKGIMVDQLDKLGVPQSQEDLQYLNDLTRFQQRMYDNANRYIKFITGAQMSQAEAERILKGIPNWKMGPERFKSAMATSKQELMWAKARANYLMRELNVTQSGLAAIIEEQKREWVARGGDPTEMPEGVNGIYISDMPGLMAKKAAEFQEQNSNASDAEIDAMVRDYFGI